MKFETSKLKHFLAACTALKIGKRTVMPILGYARITCQQGETSLTVSNLGESLKLYGTKSSDGERIHSTIPLEALKIAAKSTLPVIEILQTKPDVFTLAGQTVIGVTADEYPSLDVLTVPSNDTENIYPGLDGLACAARAMSTDESRFNLNGVYFDKDKRAVIGCDGHRLHISNGLSTFKASCIIPAPFVHAAIKLAKAYKLENPAINLDYEKNVARLSTPLFQLASRFIDGTFPNIDQVLPKDSKLSFSLYDTTHWINTFKQFCAWSPDKKEYPCTLTQVDDRYVLQGKHAATGEFSQELNTATKYEAIPENKISFNASYFMEALEALKEHAIDVSFSGQLGPILIQSANKKIIVMPMRG